MTLRAVLLRYRKDPRVIVTVPLLVLAATLTLLVSREGVPAAGHLGALHQLIRLVVVMALLFNSLNAF